MSGGVMLSFITSFFTRLYRDDAPYVRPGQAPSFRLQPRVCRRSWDLARLG